MSSPFGTNGFDKYPNFHLDREAVHRIAEWPDQHLNDKIAEYRDFARKPDILPRHRDRAAGIQRHLEFEGDYRDGVLQFLGELATFNKIEDESCAQA